jgi:hypothetical protein
LAVGRTYRFDTSAVSTSFNLYQKDLSGAYVELITEDASGNFLEIVVDNITRNHIIYDSGVTPSQGSSIDIIGSDAY